jgi:hypothetical protein
VQHVFTLVHGTWARHSKWADFDSALYRALLDAWGPDTVVRPFSWWVTIRPSHGASRPLSYRTALEMHCEPIQTPATT